MFNNILNSNNFIKILTDNIIYDKRNIPRSTNNILNHVDKIQSIPTDIVHGRYDVNCRVRGAYELKNVLPQANLHVIEAGAHSPYEPYMMNELVGIMDRLVH